MIKPLKILFKFPSRGRPGRFFDSLDSIVNNLWDKDNFHISCTLDEDDAIMNTPEIKNRIKEYPNTSTAWGTSASKIDAINRSMPSNLEWDIIVCMSDDMRYSVFGFDEQIRIDMGNFFPDLDGLLHYPDQDAKELLATMYIAGRKFYDRFGYIYHPSYVSLFCDNEIMECAQKLGKYMYINNQINTHLNPAYGHLEKDSMFLEQQSHWARDEENYNNRKANNFYL